MTFMRHLVLLSPVLALSSACTTEPTGRFVLVEETAERLDLPPDDEYLELDYRSFDECPFDDWTEVRDVDPETGEAYVRPVDPDAMVMRAAYDTLTDDGYTNDASLIRALSRTLDGADTTRCGPDGTPPLTPYLCDSIADSSGLLDDETQAALCDPWWTECFAAMSDRAREATRDEEDDFSLFFYVSDIRFTPAPSDDVRAQCSCSSDPADIVAAHNSMKASYDWNLWDRVVYGDSSITVQNDTYKWSPKGDADNSNRNAGVCGAWLYTDAAFKALSKPGPEDSASELQQFCGAASVLDIASSADVALQPVTTLWLGRSNTDRNLRLGGYGDLSNAWVLQGRDDSSRVCPTCDAGQGNSPDSCDVSTGAARLVFGDDLRHRISDESAPLHLLMAECAPRVDSVELGWQQACWHAEVPLDNFAPGTHTLVNVHGFGDSVARDTSALRLD